MIGLIMMSEAGQRTYSLSFYCICINFIPFLISPDIPKLIFYCCMKSQNWKNWEDFLNRVEKESGGKSKKRKLSAFSPGLLEKLQMDDLKVYIDLLESLSKIKFPILKSATFMNCGIEGKNVKYLIHTHMPELSQLDLSNNQVEESGCSLLAQGNWKKLEQLSLNGNNINSRAICRLFEGNWSRLKILTLNNNPISDEGIKNIRFNSTFFYSLDMLELRAVGLTAVGCRYLTQTKFTYLRSLNLSENKIQEKGWKHLCVHGQFPSINHISIVDCEIRESILFLFKSTFHKTLDSIYLWDNESPQSIRKQVNRMTGINISI